MITKSIYAIQPYHVGRKERKSLAVIIPAKIAKEFNVNTSTIFVVRADKSNKSLTLRMIDDERNTATPTGMTLESFQQVSTAGTQ
jgi:antitoxin component of MazEF toxin-antitoxin module